MSSARAASVATGTLFILATVAALAAAQVVPALGGNDYLLAIADHPRRLAAAALLYLVAAGTSVGIAVALYPVLKKTNAALALGAVVFRTIEAVFYVAAIVSLLALVPLGQKSATAGADSQAAIRTVADALLGMRDHATLLGVFAFSTGALMYYVAFFRTRLIPRWLAGWGTGATLLMMAACCLALFSNSPITGYVPFILPILVQEMVLAVWLLVKGFAGENRL